MRSFSEFLNEASKGFKGFNDPWAVMSDADRKEANRLTRLILKVMPSSPKQKELVAKRNAILAKYFPQWAKKEDLSMEDSVIAELFDQPLPVRETGRLGSGMATAEVVYSAPADGKKLEIRVTKISVHGWEVDFTLDGLESLTHAGKPWRILATVAKAVKMFLNDYGRTWDEYPKELRWVTVSNEPKRDSVYTAMLDRMGKMFGYRIVDRKTYSAGPYPAGKRMVTTARLPDGRSE